MRLETFRAPDLASVARLAREALGEDATVVRTTTKRMADGSTAVEIVAADGEDVERFRARLTPSPLPVRAGPAPLAIRPQTPPRGLLRAFRSSQPTPALSPAVRRPFVIALVGPAGAGKTTAAAKLAAHAESLGGARAGLVTLDTRRPGAVEQVRAHADAARAPLEVVYDPREAEPALRRLGQCEVVVVDTPARAGGEGDARTAELLRALRPDETHFVLDAGVRLEVAGAAQRACDPLNVTHLLLTRLDAVPEGAGVAELAAWLDLPTRWVSEGGSVPDDVLRPATPRIMAVLGATSAAAVAPLAPLGRRRTPAGVPWA